MDVIARVGPMIHHDDYESFRDKSISPQLEIKVRQPDGEKTMWGDDTMSNYCFVDDLSQAGLEFVDLIDEGYEIWFREKPFLENGEHDTTDRAMRYAISWLVGKAAESGAGPSDLHIFQIKSIGEWMVVTPAWGNINQRMQFWERFGVGEEYGPGFGWSENPIHDALFDAVIEKRSELLDSFKVKQIPITEEMRKTGLPCKHCQELSDKTNSEERLEEWMGGEHKADSDLLKADELLKKMKR